MTGGADASPLIFTASGTRFHLIDRRGGDLTDYVPARGSPDHPETEFVSLPVRASEPD